MALSKAELKELLRQVPTFDESQLPTLEDKKKFIASQIEATQGAVYRQLVDVEVAKEFAAQKQEAYQEKARERLTESAAVLKAYKPTLQVLSRIAAELEK